MSRVRTHIVTPESTKVEQLLKAHPSPRDHQKLLVARMACTGEFTLAMIAKAAGKARSTVQRWLDKFQTGGVDLLLDRKKPPGRTSELTEKLQAKIQEKLKQGAWRTARQFRSWLAQSEGIVIEQSTSYTWLGKCGGALKAPRPCHRKQAPGAVDQFKTHGWAEALASLNIEPGQPVHFWVMDESRFGLHTIVRHCWGLKGHRVVAPFQQVFQWEYLYGAINVMTGEPVFCHMPSVTTEITWDFLKQVEKTKPNEHHVILWDGAGFHQPPLMPENDPDKLCVGLEKVHVIKLPAYCPELNPTEKVWDQVKDTVCNRAYDSLEALREALLPILKDFWERPDGLRSVMGYGKNWLGQLVNAISPNNLPSFKRNWS